MLSKTLEILYSLINIFFVTLRIYQDVFKESYHTEEYLYVMLPENNTLLIIQLKGKIYLFQSTRILLMINYQ